MLDRPTFVIIGAQKAGTTSVYRYVGQHPEVFVSPVKEPRFFSYLAQCEAGIAPPAGAIQTLDAYRKLFDGAETRAIGEASVSYLDVPGTAAILHRHLPHAHLIALLRDPAERAYSQYLMRLRTGREHGSFADAVDQGRCLRGGFYARNLAPYDELFGADRLGLFLYDDLRRDPLGLMRDMFRFLEIDDSFVPHLGVRHNAGGRPRSRAVHRLLSLPRVNAAVRRAAPSWLVQLGTAAKRLNYDRPPMPDAVRARLHEIYRADTMALERRLGRDLSAWRGEASG